MLTFFICKLLIQVAMATGQVLFQRFYYSKSFIRHDVEVRELYHCMALNFGLKSAEVCQIHPVTR